MHFLASTLFSLFSLSQLAHAAPRPAPATGDLTIDFGTSSNSTSSNSSSTANKSWTVIVDDDDPRTLAEMMEEVGVDPNELKHVYNNTAFKGFAGVLSDVHLNKMSIMSGLKTFEPEMEIAVLDVQTNAPWGLQRISQGSPIADPPTDDNGIGGYNFKYQFDGSISGLGKGVDIYVIDTGINTDHVDFDGRASVGYSIDNLTDEVGHGTHCAGTAASTTFGIAKSANIIAIKVLGTSSGSSADILAGIDFMMTNHEERSAKSGFMGSVASMSLGSSTRSTSLDEAVARASAEGIHFVVAAGNENQDACNSSPAAASKGSDVIAVGAVTIDGDARATFSNFGECTTVYAPGEKITSTWIGGSNKINTISGTSMACPHVTGLVAYYLSQDASLATDTAAMKSKIQQTALTISIDHGDVLLANNGFTTAANKRSFEPTFDNVHKIYY